MKYLCTHPMATHFFPNITKPFVMHQILGSNYKLHRSLWNFIVFCHWWGHVLTLVLVFEVSTHYQGSSHSHSKNWKVSFMFEKSHFGVSFALWVLLVIASAILECMHYCHVKKICLVNLGQHLFGFIWIQILDLLYHHPLFDFGWIFYQL